MPINSGHANHESAETLLVTDKRGRRLQHGQWEGEALPISELGSKAIYQVCAERFVPVVP
jgi:hypothetical protein